MKKAQHISAGKRAITFLGKWPLHIILMPLFFVSSIYVQLAGLLQVSEITWAFLKVMMGLLIFFAVIYLFYKDKNKAGIITTIAGTFILFFGDIKDILTGIPVIKYISSYAVLSFLIPVAGIFFLYRIHKTRSVVNTTLFLNILFLFYLGMEVWKWQQLGNSLKTTDQTIQLTPLSSKEQLPDIYYIVLDSYPSSQYQREVLGVYPNFLDSALHAKSFYVVKHPKSNYHITSFSVAATLQMKYLDWMGEVPQAKPRHYSDASVAIKQSVTLAWLNKTGYRFYNLSIFDLPGHLSVNKERFFSTTSDEIIYYNTLWSRIKWQVIPALWPSSLKKLGELQKKNLKTLVGKFKDYNQHIFDSLQRLPSSQMNVSPKFIYAHFEMPHYPYFYDSTGKAYPENEVFSPSMTTDKKRFRNYIAYTNNRILSLINTVLDQTNNSVIVLQSDHGTKNLDETRQGDAFANYSSFYFPDQDYRLLYDSISNVNTFRIIFNKYFHQQLPLLPDSSIYIN